MTSQEAQRIHELEDMGMHTEAHKLYESSHAEYYVQEQDSTGHVFWTDGPHSNYEEAAMLADEVNRVRNYTTETYVIKSYPASPEDYDGYGRIWSDES
jgi:hypothetical protein